MKFYDATKENFELCNLDGTPVAFTNSRLDRSTIPKGLYCYDVRDSDLCDGTCAELVEGHIWVNHWGTILSKTPFEMESFGCYVVEDNSFIGESITAEEMADMDEATLQAKMDMPDQGMEMQGFA